MARSIAISPARWRCATRSPERWLDRVSAPLAKIVAEDAPAAQRLRRWFDRLIAIKRQKAKVEPELFATYLAIFEQSRAVVHTHVEHLSAQIAAIIADGIARGEFADCDAAATGRSVFYATARFHDPAYAREWNDPGLDAAFDDAVGADPARTGCRRRSSGTVAPDEEASPHRLTPF